MKTKFKDKEKLYRGVSKKPRFIKRDNTVTRNVFTYTDRNSNGCSVFRQMERSNEEAISDSIVSLDGHADSVLSISYGEYQKADIYVEYTPSKNSIYHSELFRNCSKDKLNDEQLDFLALNCKIERLNNL